MSLLDWLMMVLGFNSPDVFNGSFVDWGLFPIMVILLGCLVFAFFINVIHPAKDPTFKES